MFLKLSRVKTFFRLPIAFSAISLELFPTHGSNSSSYFLKTRCQSEEYLESDHFSTKKTPILHRKNFDNYKLFKCNKKLRTRLFLSFVIHNLHNFRNVPFFFFLFSLSPNISNERESNVLELSNTTSHEKINTLYPRVTYPLQRVIINVVRVNFPEDWWLSFERLFWDPGGFVRSLNNERLHHERVVPVVARGWKITGGWRRGGSRGKSKKPRCGITNSFRPATHPSFSFFPSFFARTHARWMGSAFRVTRLRKCF